MEALGFCISCLEPGDMAVKFSMFVTPMVMTMEGVVSADSAVAVIPPSSVHQLTMSLDHVASLVTSTVAPPGVLHPMCTVLAEVSGTAPCVASVSHLCILAFAFCVLRVCVRVRACSWTWTFASPVQG